MNPEQNIRKKVLLVDKLKNVDIQIKLPTYYHENRTLSLTSSHLIINEMITDLNDHGVVAKKVASN